MVSLSQGRDAVSEEKNLVRTVSHGNQENPDPAEKHEKSGAKLVSVGSMESKKDRHSHSGKNGKPKKGDIPCGLSVNLLHSTYTFPLHSFAFCGSPIL